MTLISAPPNEPLEVGDTHALFEEARHRRRRRQVWIGSVLVLSLALGAGFLFGSAPAPRVRTTVGSVVRSGGPLLPGKTGLHVDVFAWTGTYVMNLDTGQVRSADIPSYINLTPRAGSVFLQRGDGSIVLPDNLQSLRRLPIEGFSAPGLRPDTFVVLSSRGNKELEVDARGKVLRSVTFTPCDCSPVAEGTSGLVVMEGPPLRRLDVLDAKGVVRQSLGYAWEKGSSFAAMAGNDRLVWIGSNAPWYPNFLNPPVPVAVHITDLRTGTDTVIAKSPGPVALQRGRLSDRRQGGRSLGTSRCEHSLSEEPRVFAQHR